MNILLTILLIISILFNIFLLELLKDKIKLLKKLEISLNKALENKININKNEDKISIKEISKPMPEQKTVIKEEPEIKKELPKEKKIIKQNQVTSPISIPKEIPVCSFELDNYINIKNPTKKNINYDYLKELSHELSKNINNQVVELTDFEKEEEENSIISYKELINNSNKKEDTKKFIDDLKDLRNRLK